VSFRFYCRPLAATRVVPGTCRLRRDGQATFNGGDLRGAAIAGKVSVLIDDELGRIAIRAAREDDPEDSLATLYSRHRTGTARMVRLTGALREVGVMPAEVAGPQIITRKDDLLVLDFGAHRRAAKKPAAMRNSRTQA